MSEELAVKNSIIQCYRNAVDSMRLLGIQIPALLEAADEVARIMDGSLYCQRWGRAIRPMPKSEIELSGRHLGEPRPHKHVFDSDFGIQECSPGSFTLRCDCGKKALYSIWVFPPLFEDWSWVTTPAGLDAIRNGS